MMRGAFLITLLCGVDCFVRLRHGPRLSPARRALAAEKAAAGKPRAKKAVSVAPAPIAAAPAAAAAAAPPASVPVVAPVAAKIAPPRADDRLLGINPGDEFDVVVPDDFAYDQAKKAWPKRRRSQSPLLVPVRLERADAVFGPAAGVSTWLRVNRVSDRRSHGCSWTLQQDSVLRQHL